MRCKGFRATTTQLAAWIEGPALPCRQPRYIAPHREQHGLPYGTATCSLTVTLSPTTKKMKPFSLQLDPCAAHLRATHLAAALVHQQSRAAYARLVPHHQTSQVSVARIKPQAQILPLGLFNPCTASTPRARRARASITTVGKNESGATRCGRAAGQDRRPEAMLPPPPATGAPTTPALHKPALHYTVHCVEAPQAQRSNLPYWSKRPSRKPHVPFNQYIEVLRCCQPVPLPHPGPLVT